MTYDDLLPGDVIYRTNGRETLVTLIVHTLPKDVEGFIRAVVVRDWRGDLPFNYVEVRGPSFVDLAYRGTVPIAGDPPTPPTSKTSWKNVFVVRGGVVHEIR